MSSHQEEKSPSSNRPKLEAYATRILSHVDPRLLSLLERRLGRIPAVRKRIDAEYKKMLGGLENSARPYRELFPVWTSLPDKGLPKRDILDLMEDVKRREEDRWREGLVSGAVYHGDPEHTEFLARVYALHSQVNPLHSDLWPSATKFEAEIVSMTANMLGSASVEVQDPEQDEICGTVTSGGTESILLAMKCYRDRARTQGIRRPEIIAPTTAHAAFDKASQYFGIRLVRTSVDEEGRARVMPMKRAIGRSTVALVGSAPCFPYGVIDPIQELSELARSSGLGFHTDACLGGFLLPWARELGYACEPFDFSLPGVTSISADTHKFGYAAKGTSVVLYRGLALRRLQYYTVADWPGGLYFSPTLAGSRPGALSAACWAAMVSLGHEGYREAARKIFETTAWLREQIAVIPELKLIGASLFVIALAMNKGDALSIYSVLEQMTRRGWNLNGLHRPPAIHLCLTLRHTQPGVRERFVDDLRAAVRHVIEHPEEKKGMAPVYGMAATLPLKGIVGDMLGRYLDILYRP